VSGLRIAELRIRLLAIPMRLTFEHAAASRNVADPVVLELVAQAPQTESGFGETLARPYVTGETTATVLQDIQTIFVPRLMELRAESFAEMVEFADGLPLEVDGRRICAARAAVELAVLDLAGVVFGRRAADAAGWLELRGFGPPGCAATARYSGIVVGRKALKQSLFLRAQRLYGLRDFKIKVAVDGWEERVRRAGVVLARAIRGGSATLRADANAGWSLPQAHAAVPLLRSAGVAALEQPLPPGLDEMLPEFADCGLDLIADESLVTLEDAERLIALGVRVFNIRIAKCGGLLPSLRIAHAVLAAGRDVQLGCLVGETSLLTAAGRAFLEACPRARFVEGAFGRRLLAGDCTRRPLQFGWGGRLTPPRLPGLGVDVDLALLDRYSSPDGVHLRL
jgi:L-Ala-D/L-Glu epimerase